MSLNGIALILNVFLAFSLNGSANTHVFRGLHLVISESQELENNAQKDRADNRAAIRKQLWRTLSFELKRIQLHLGSSSFEFSKIEQQLSSTIEQICQKPESTQYEILSANQNQQLRAKIYEVVSAELTPEKQAHFNDYKKQARLSQKQLDSIGKQAVLMALDDYLCFSEEQSKKVEKLLVENWTPQKLLLASGIEFRDKTLLKSFIDLQSLEQLLSKEQSDVFNKISRFPILWTNCAYQDLNLKVVNESYKLLLSARIAEFQRRGDLSERQFAILRVAAKKAALEVTEWHSLSPRLPFLDLVKRYNESMLSRIEKRPIWELALRKVFSPEQVQAINEEKKARLKFYRKYHAEKMIAWLRVGRADFVLGFEQQRRLKFLVERHLEIDTCYDNRAIHIAAQCIQQEELKAFLNDEQIQVIQSWIESRANLYRQLNR